MVEFRSRTTGLSSLLMPCSVSASADGSFARCMGSSNASVSSARTSFSRAASKAVMSPTLASAQP